MYYFIQTDDAIEKYSVNYKKEDLFNLKLEVIENFNEGIHMEYTASKGPNQLDDLRIRNLKKERISNFPIEEYHFSYDKYIFPDIVMYIDKLLNDDLSVLPDIFSKDLSVKNIEFKDEEEYKKYLKLIKYYKLLQQIIDLRLVEYKEIYKPLERAKEL